MDKCATESVCLLNVIVHFVFVVLIEMLEFLWNVYAQRQPFSMTCTCKKLRISFERAIMLMMYLYIKHGTLEWNGNGRKDKSCALALLFVGIYRYIVCCSRATHSYQTNIQEFGSLFWSLC